MVRRWDDDCGHQLECDDDAASITSTAAAVSEAEGRRHGPSRLETGQATPPRSGPVRFGGPERRQPRGPAGVLGSGGVSIGGQCGHRDRQHCWQSQAAATGVTRRRISTPWAPHARCDLVSALAYTGTAEQSCKIDSYADLSKLRTRVDHDMYSKFVKIGRRELEIPGGNLLVSHWHLPRKKWDGIVFYPTYLEKGGMGKFSFPATQVG